MLCVLLYVLYIYVETSLILQCHREEKRWMENQILIQRQLYTTCFPFLYLFLDQQRIILTHALLLLNKKSKSFKWVLTTFKHNQCP